MRSSLSLHGTATTERQHATENYGLPGRNLRWNIYRDSFTETLPTAVFMLKSYFDTIPDEIEEAAMMDGLNRLQIIFRITVPLAMSGLISVFVYCFMVAWNDYLFASIFLSSASNFTLPVGLNALFSTPDYIWGRMMAASLVTALPVVIMYALSERFIKSGLTAGGVKG